MTASVSNAFRARSAVTVHRDAGEIVRELRPLEPAYLFCEGKLRERARRFLQGFPGTVSYAVKANHEARVLRTLVSAGVNNFDVASLQEIRSVLTQYPAASLHFNNPVKAEEAIEEAYRRYDVRSFALDEFSELNKIQAATGGDRTVLYTVRFKLAHDNAAYDFGSKFGAEPDKAVALLQTLTALGARTALTFHPGSQCTDPAMYARYLAGAADIVARAGVTPEFINVGGGFPEYYLDTDLPALEEYFQVIAEAMHRCFAEPIPLMCEPGRGMVAAAVSLLARVIHVRDCGRSLFLNDGVYGGMLEQSVVNLRFPAQAWRGGRALPAGHASYHIFGPTCDPIDRLLRPATLPEGLQVGDHIEFGLLGAYGSVTSTSFNGFQPGAYMDVLTGTDFS
jgi:ornithine decarboxylase